ncbi:transposase [Motilimonas sp. E26]|uniref:transposase n=1 Tax=Motilimonas sp. E26 TaxID=2865674 RepID=UPI0032B7A0B8|nr:transposase [Motilimonas sp. E26]
MTFRYRDGQTNHWKQRTLPTLKFLMLMLQHVLPKGLQRLVITAFYAVTPKPSCTKYSACYCRCCNSYWELSH